MAYLKLFRFPLIFTAIADSAAGYLLNYHGVSPDLRVLLLLALASGGLYCFGMAMNDVADRERDKELTPNRVLPSGRLSVAQALAACAGVLALSGAAVLLVPGGSLLPRLAVWGAMFALIVVYDWAVKLPPVMGLIRALNFLLGAVAVEGIPGLKGLATLALLGGTSFVYVTALTFVSTLEEGEFRKPRLYAGAGAMAVAAVVPTLWGSLSEGFWATGPSWVVALVLAGAVLWRAYMALDRSGVMLLVRDGVAGIILLDATYLLSRRSWEGFGVLALLLPAVFFVAWFRKRA